MQVTTILLSNQNGKQPNYKKKCLFEAFRSAALTFLIYIYNCFLYYYFVHEDISFTHNFFPTYTGQRGKVVVEAIQVSNIKITITLIDDQDFYRVYISRVF